VAIGRSESIRSWGAASFWYPLAVNDPWTDPFIAAALVIMAAVLCAVAVLCYLLRRMSERLERRIPAYRRPLEATYSRFHRFLLIVQIAALRRTRG
jgi:hypothetical protein